MNSEQANPAHWLLLTAHVNCDKITRRLRTHGSVAELADAGDLKSSEGNLLWVRFPPELLVTTAFVE